MLKQRKIVQIDGAPIKPRWSAWAMVVAWMLILASASIAPAQDAFDEGVDLFPNLSLGGFGEQTSEPAEWSTRYLVADGASEGRLEIEVELARGWHVYSVTQPPGGPLRTKLALGEATGVELVDAFSPNENPAKSVSEIFGGLTVEEHEGSVVWSAPIKVPVGFRDPIPVSVKAQVCKTDGACVPVSLQLTASFAGQTDGTDDAQVGGGAAPVAGSPFRDGDYVVQWQATLEPSVLPPGGRGTIKFTAKPDKTYHVYIAAVDDADSSTNFVVIKKSGLMVGKPVPNRPAVPSKLLPGIHYHDGNVTWSLTIEVPKSAAAGAHPIEGYIAYQACTETSCLLPKAIKFTTELQVAAKGDPGKAAAVKMVAAKRAEVLDLAAETEWVDKLDGDTGAPGAEEKSEIAPVTTAAPQSKSVAFPLILMLAFFGGVILNVMPCVLPVVGLKIMGFVSQAGENRSRVLLLNLVYVAGILSVFAILAGLAVVLSFGWGEQFTYFPVRLGLALLLFALALSYLGVWEIPVPGMASGAASQQLQKREGLVGAFSKGVFATILATPCSGPLLGYILGLTIQLSGLQTIIVIMSVGIGMSLPYLVIGAQPKLVSWLPKPGAWMETLKQFMAFLFLATVAFFFAGFSDGDKLPVFCSLIGVWFGCWIIGLVPNWDAIEKRLTAWGVGIAAAALIGFASFHYLVPGPKVLAWEPYSEARLQQLQREGRTVLIDFTAKWCGNCIYNYNVAINTEPTRELVDELNAVTLLADWTDYNDEIKAKLTELNSRSIPLLAIYPGQRPGEPIILRDIVTQTAVLDALRQAGASTRSSSIAGKHPSPSIASATH